MIRTSIPEIGYETVSIKDIVVDAVYGKNRCFKADKSTVSVAGVKLRPTGRFWASFCYLYGVGSSMFKYFPPEESFQRIAEKERNDKIQVAVEVNGGADALDHGVPLNAALAVTRPGKPMLYRDEGLEMLGDLNANSLKYHNGRLFGRIKPRHNFNAEIAGDMHEGFVNCELPIDGYGLPNMYLSLLRQICVNGAIAYAKEFKTEVIVGKDPVHTFVRAAQAYSNDEGFAALRDRFRSAAMSQASIYEAVSIRKIIAAFEPDAFTPSFVASIDKGGDCRNRAAAMLAKKTGNIEALYGIAQIDAISEKRIRQVPTKATVYDLLCFASEMAEHQLQSQAGQKLSMWIGKMVSHEYDLENSVKEIGEFVDFFDPASKKVMEKNLALS